MSRIVRELLDHGCAPEAVERLLHEHGGRPLSVPRNPGPEHPITRAAGTQVARVLAAMFGGERITMPMGAALRRERLRQQIHALKRDGTNHIAIARQLRLHLRYVQRVAAEDPASLFDGRPDPRQGDLFAEAAVASTGAAA